MNHWQYQPHAVLSPFVQCLWVSTEDFTDPNKVLEILPDAEIELIFGFGSPIWVEHQANPFRRERSGHSPRGSF
jgi:hypothetical protein